MRKLFLLLSLNLSFIHLFIDNYNQLVIANTLFTVNTCTSQPELAQDIILLGDELGVKLSRGNPKLIGKDATYEAYEGKLGSIIVTDKKLSPSSFCKLITHEFIHVLQHLKGNLQQVIPLGWPLHYEQIYNHENLQEAEAYAYQDQPIKVIYYLENYVRKNF